jgi:hypothetical protein
MPTKSSGWQVLYDSKKKENEQKRVKELRELVAADLGVKKVGASNLFRYALSLVAEKHGKEKFPILQHGGSRKKTAVEKKPKKHSSKKPSAVKPQSASRKSKD